MKAKFYQEMANYFKYNNYIRKIISILYRRQNLILEIEPDV